MYRCLLVNNSSKESEYIESSIDDSIGSDIDLTDINTYTNENSDSVDKEV